MRAWLANKPKPKETRSLMGIVAELREQGYDVNYNDEVVKSLGYIIADLTKRVRDLENGQKK